MFFDEFPEFNIEGLTGLDNNSFCDNNFDFEEFHWDMSNVAGPSQPYAGVDVRGDLDSYPRFPSPDSAPTSLYPTQGVFPNEGKSCCAPSWLSFNVSRSGRRVPTPVLSGHGHALLPATIDGHSSPLVHLPPLRRLPIRPGPFARL